MSYLALAIARNEGLDIVTDRAHLHESLVAEKEADVFSKLLGLPDSKHGDETEDFADDLGQLIVTTQFDVGVLDARDILELLNKKRDLRSPLSFAQIILRFLRVEGSRSVGSVASLRK
jgi:hypothetical protein